MTAAVAAATAAAEEDDPLMPGLTGGSNDDDANCNSGTTTGAEDGEEAEAEEKPLGLEKDLLMDMLLDPDDDDLIGPSPLPPMTSNKYMKIFKDNQFPQLLYNPSTLGAGLGAIAGTSNWGELTGCAYVLSLQKCRFLWNN